MCMLQNTKFLIENQKKKQKKNNADNMFTAHTVHKTKAVK